MRVNIKMLSMSVLAATLATAGASAATVGTGNFSLAGGAIGSTGGVNFYFMNSAPPDQQAVVIPAASGAPGVFSDLTVGSIQSIQNLTVGNGVIPGTTFDFTNWIKLTDGINLDATTAPLHTLPICGAGAVAVGYECILNAQSPVIVTQGTAGITLKFSVFGSAHYSGQTALTPFDAEFSASDTQPGLTTVAGFASYFSSNGLIPAVPYEVNISTTPSSSTPEPAAFWLACAGMLGFGVLGRKRASR